MYFSKLDREVGVRYVYILEEDKKNLDLNIVMKVYCKGKI